MKNLKGYLIYPELFYLPISELASYIGVNGAYLLRPQVKKQV